MGLISWLFGKYIDKIETGKESNNLMTKYNINDSEIKYGAKLIVKESQVSIFSYQNSIADNFTTGEYILNSDTLPFLAKLQNWDLDYSDPFKADIYFFNTKPIEQKWQTKESILLKDPKLDIVKFNFQGNFKLQIKEPRKLLEDILDENGEFSTKILNSEIINYILHQIPIILGRHELTTLEVLKNSNKLQKYLQKNLQKKLNSYGLFLEKFIVSDVVAPKELQKKLKEIAKQNSHRKQNQLMKPFYIIKNGKANGPHELESIKEMINLGKLTKDSYIWQEGLKDWVKVDILLKGLFENEANSN